jgi:hypothetical protein
MACEVPNSYLLNVEPSQRNDENLGQRHQRPRNGILTFSVDLLFRFITGTDEMIFKFTPSNYVLVVAKLS